MKVHIGDTSVLLLPFEPLRLWRAGRVIMVHDTRVDLAMVSGRLCN